MFSDIRLTTGTGHGEDIYRQKLTNARNKDFFFFQRANIQHVPAHYWVKVRGSIRYRVIGECLTGERREGRKGVSPMVIGGQDEEHSWRREQ